MLRVPCGPWRWICLLVLERSKLQRTDHISSVDISELRSKTTMPARKCGRQQLV